MKRSNTLLFLAGILSIIIVQSCSEKVQQAKPVATSSTPITPSPKPEEKSTATISTDPNALMNLEGIDTSGVFQIINQSGPSLEIPNSSKAAGGTADIKAYANTAFQKWRLTLKTGNYVTIQNTGSHLYIESNKYNGREVLIQVAANGTDAQLFGIYPVNGDYFKIINKVDGLAVTASHEGRIQLRAFTGSSSQIWSANQLSLFTTQAAYGPGGTNYPYTGVTEIKLTANGTTSYIFQPSPMPGKALPCISYQHGYLATPALSQNKGYINHLVKKGYVVIYNEFQPTADTNPKTYEAIAASNIKAAIAYIANNPSTCVQIAAAADGSKQFGLAGYSVGGITSVNLAANYVADSIPKPKFLYTMEANSGGHLAPMRNANTIPADIFVVIVDGQDDVDATFDNSATFWNQMIQVPVSHKQWIGIYSDRHPNSAALNLVAHHLSPNSKSPNTLNFYGYYKWTTALADFAFYGTNYNYWWGNTSDEDYMGTWPDGTPVNAARGGLQAFWPGH